MPRYDSPSNNNDQEHPEHLSIIGPRYVQLPALATDNVLVSLDLSFSLSDTSGIQLAEGLKVNTRLRTLILIGHPAFYAARIGKNAIKELSLALRQNTSLTYLDLSQNYLCDEAAKHLGTMLKKNNSLRQLFLVGHDDIVQKFRTKGLKYLSSGLEKNRSLTVLDISHHRIDSSSVKYLAAALEKNSGLTKLSMSNSFLGSAGIEYIANALRNNTVLVELDVSASFIQSIEKGSDYQIFFANPQLTFLDIGLNFFRDTTSNQILDSLATNTALISLGLNYIVQNSTHLNVKLCKIISSNSTLKQLSIKGISFTRDLAEALEENTSLQEINLAYARFKDEDVEHLIELLTRNTVLAQVNLQDARMSSKSKNKLERFSRRNRHVRLLCLETIGRNTLFVLPSGFPAHYSPLGITRQIREYESPQFFSSEPQERITSILPKSSQHRRKRKNQRIKPPPHKSKNRLKGTFQEQNSGGHQITITKSNIESTTKSLPVAEYSSDDNNHSCDKISSVSSSDSQKSDSIQPGLSTESDGNCFFHALMGKLDDNGVYFDENAQERREEFASWLAETYRCLADLHSEEFTHWPTDGVDGTRSLMPGEVLAAVIINYCECFNASNNPHANNPLLAHFYNSISDEWLGICNRAERAHTEKSEAHKNLREAIVELCPELADAISFDNEVMFTENYTLALSRANAEEKRVLENYYNIFREIPDASSIKNHSVRVSEIIYRQYLCLINNPDYYLDISEGRVWAFHAGVQFRLFSPFTDNEMVIYNPESTVRDTNIVWHDGVTPHFECYNDKYSTEDSGNTVKQETGTVEPDQLPKSDGPSSNLQNNMVLNQLLQRTARIERTAERLEPLGITINPCPFGDDKNAEAKALNSLYRFIRGYLTNLITGARAVASDVVKRGNYRTEDKLKSAFTSLVQASGAIGELFSVLSKSTGEEISFAGVVTEVAHLAGEIAGEATERLFVTQKEKLNKLTMKCDTYMSQDLLVSTTAKKLVEIHREPVLLARLTTEGLESLAAQMVLRIFSAVQDGTIDNDVSDDLVTDVVIYQPPHKKLWFKLFNTKLQRRDNAGDKITSLDILSYSGLRWNVNSDTYGICELSKKSSAVRLGYRNMPLAMAQALREEKIPYRWDTIIFEELGNLSVSESDDEDLLATPTSSSKIVRPTSRPIMTSGIIPIVVTEVQNDEEIKARELASAKEKAGVYDDDKIARAEQKHLLFTPIHSEIDRRNKSAERGEGYLARLKTLDKKLVELRNYSRAPIRGNYFKNFVACLTEGLLLRIFVMHFGIGSNQEETNANVRDTLHNFNMNPFQENVFINAADVAINIANLANEKSEIESLKNLKKISNQFSKLIYKRFRDKLKNMEFPSQQRFALVCVERLMNTFYRGPKSNITAIINDGQHSLVRALLHCAYQGECREHENIRLTFMDDTPDDCTSAMLFTHCNVLAKELEDEWCFWPSSVGLDESEPNPYGFVYGDGYDIETLMPYRGHSNDYLILREYTVPSASSCVLL